MSVVVLSASAAAAGSPESLAVSAGESFQAFSYAAASAGFRPALSAGMPKLDAAQAAAIARQVDDSSSLLSPLSLGRPGAAPKSDLELGPLLNRHLKTSLKYQFNGRTVWFSGGFDAAQTAYVSILVDGAAPLYFNVKALLGNEQHLSIGDARYTLSLSPNIFHRMKSTISLKNDANAREAARFSVQDVLDAIAASGLSISLFGQSYTFFYADGVAGSGPMFVFIHGNSRDYHVFLIPEDKVPADRPAMFSLFGGQQAGFARHGTSLQIYENS